MRNLFSYILLISLLFPTVVEAFHAVHDSHDITIDKNLNINESKFHCQIFLFSNQEDESDFFVGYSYESYISHNFTHTFKRYTSIILDADYSVFFNRGPPLA